MNITDFPPCSIPCLNQTSVSALETPSLCQDLYYLHSVDYCWELWCTKGNHSLAGSLLNNYCASKGFDVSRSTTPASIYPFSMPYSSTPGTSGEYTDDHGSTAYSTVMPVTSASALNNDSYPMTSGRAFSSNEALPQSTSAPSADSGLSKGETAAIAGSVLGLLVLVLPVMVAFWYWRRHKRRASQRLEDEKDETEYTGDGYDSDGDTRPFSESEHYGTVSSTPVSAHPSAISLPFDSTAPQLRVANPSLDLPRIAIPPPAHSPTTSHSSSSQSQKDSVPTPTSQSTGVPTTPSITTAGSTTYLAGQPLTPEQARALQGLLAMPREEVASVLQLMTTPTGSSGTPTAIGPPPAYER